MNALNTFNFRQLFMFILHTILQAFINQYCLEFSLPELGNKIEKMCER